jgi:hypothetical protein
MVDGRGRMLAFRDETTLTTPDFDFWVKGGHKGLTIVDSAGVTYRVKQAQKVGFPGFLFGYSLLRRRRVKVAFVFQDAPTPMDLNGLKNMVLASVAAHGGLWEATDVERLTAGIKGATSPRELILRLF